MDTASASALIKLLYGSVLKRDPASGEFAHWAGLLERDELNVEQVIRKFHDSDEYRERQLNGLPVVPAFLDGHYHSPVVDPRTVGPYVAQERVLDPEQLAGIQLDALTMRRLWLKNLDFTRRSAFEDQPTPHRRYGYLGGPFPYGDAITLRMMIRHLGPRRIIEIGSGYSTACMLDTADELGDYGISITCIDPDTARLRSLLRPADYDRVTIFERPVQEVLPEIVDTLRANDLLFIDSTHVLKTGSDVHFEFFHLLPRLKPGVVVHFHDILYPFEYPHEWIFDLNYSWNEAYVLRSSYSVEFWNGLFARKFANEIREEFPTFMKNPGGSIYLQRVG